MLSSPRTLSTNLLERIPGHHQLFPELKDPSIIRLPDGRFELFASIGNSLTQTWKIGRFASDQPEGPWTEQPFIDSDICGTQVCAPAMEYVADDQQPWKMYVQTSCFQEDGVIVKAASVDGQFFTQESIPHITKEHTRHAIPSVGVYDAGISQLEWNGERYRALLFSGYRRIGCGDLYLTLQRWQDTSHQWEQPVSILKQEEVPYHNSPDDEQFEWGLEGAKLVQLSPKLFVLIGVCFLPGTASDIGQRQRIFFALSSSPYGPYYPWGLPLSDQDGAIETVGEHGHPDMEIIDGQVWMWYQKREGSFQPWYLKSVSWDVQEFTSQAQLALDQLRGYLPSFNQATGWAVPRPRPSLAYLG
jgi:hypothetical protein